MTEKQKAYLICDSHPDKKDHFGDCWGRCVAENGSHLNHWFSSSTSFLRSDLKRFDDADDYEFVDLIGQPLPDKFKRGGQP